MKNNSFSRQWSFDCVFQTQTENAGDANPQIYCCKIQTAYGQESIMLLTEYFYKIDLRSNECAKLFSRNT